MKQFLLPICVCWLLSGCIQPISKLKNDQDIPLDANTGYLLMSVDTNIDLHSIIIGGTKSLKLTEQDLKWGSNYIMVDVPAGDYDINDIKLNRYLKIELTDDMWNFHIEPGKINYIGHLSVDALWSLYSLDGVKAILENQSTSALEYLEVNFPQIYKVRELNYAGPGEDHFFEYARKIKKGSAL
ncbi:hypothetical protein [Shewanella sp. S23-S33]|uniref:hypothetical protein n=1 Tax=Shewanella TaxID=22 RepID=UPI00372CF639